MLSTSLRRAATQRSSPYLACLSSQSSTLHTSTKTGEKQQQNILAYLGLAAAAAATGTSLTFLEEKWNYQKLPTQKYPDPPSYVKHGASSHHSELNNPPKRPDLPIIPLAEVEEHNDEDSMWFIFRGAVFDMTFFKNGHPGGTPRLLMAAGQDLEPYWEVYRQHFRSHIIPWMEKYRVGSLSEEDQEKLRKNRMEFGDMYETDPIRDKNNLPCTYKPYCGEPRIDILTEDYYTPNELFYVRNHLAVPDIDPEEYVLIVKGKGLKKHKFTLKDLKTMFPRHEAVTTLQCAGNRREDLHGDRKIYISPHWVIGAISNAKWGGVKLRDVLKHCGMDVDGVAFGDVNDDRWKHVQFEGYDTDETGLCYGGSIPIDKAVDPLGDCLIAFEMNGKPLPRDHGFPVRAISPGHAGARQCKWLHKIIVSDKESQKSWQQKSYRGFAPDIDFERDLSHWGDGKLRLDQAPIVQEMPVTSLVCNPPQNSLVGMKGANDFTLKGVAWSGGGRKIERVDVSIDGGKTFTAAELYKPIEQRRNRHWAWTHFSKTLPLPEHIKARLDKGEIVKLEVTSKAMNSDFNVQPENVAPYWNARGVCINHWYRVNLLLDPNRPKGELYHAGVEDEFGNVPSGGKFAIPWGQHGWMTDPEHQSDPRENVAPEAKHF